MSVRAGREFLAIPGPTTVPDEVLRAMHRPAVEIYSGPLLALTEGLMRDVARVFNTKGRAYIYTANGHGAWEAALTNVLSKGDRILVLESGRFAISWGEHARRMGVEVEVLKGDMRHAVRPAEVEARLKADRKSSGGTIKAVLVAQIDTASGVVNDIAAIGQAIRAAGHDALLMVDAVASLGCMPFDMDDWGVDVAMSGSQKGLMAPPGLGFVAANERAREAHKKAGLRTPYWDWTEREGEQHYQKYAGTPPEHLLYALRQALDLMFEEGLRERVPSPSPAGRGGATRGRRLGGRPGDRLQHHRARRALRHRDPRADQGARPRGAARLLRRASAAWSWATASASSRVRHSASPIWAMSTRR